MEKLQILRPFWKESSDGESMKPFITYSINRFNGLCLGNINIINKELFSEKSNHMYDLLSQRYSGDPKYIVFVSADIVGAGELGNILAWPLFHTLYSPAGAEQPI